MGRSFNWTIFLLTLLLSIFSLALVHSVAPEFFLSQLVYFILGFFFFFAFGRLDYRILKDFGWYWWGIVVTGLTLTFIFGQLTRQTVRWVKIGSLSLQPSELAKPLIILTLASFLTAHKTSWKNLFLAGLLLMTPAGLVFLQPDLGSAILIVSIWLVMIFFWLDSRKFGVLLIGMILFSLLGWNLLRDYQKDRLQSFLDPAGDPLGSGYHLIQAKIAAGSGKIFGRGLFRGTQSHLQFLPERHTDFIFASLAEELGFFGSLVLVSIYFFILAQILKVARKCRDAYGFFISLGVFAIIFAQAVINIGMNIGLMPITGITLPLISTGGSSIMALMICLGLVEGVARRESEGRALEIT